MADINADQFTHRMGMLASNIEREAYPTSAIATSLEDNLNAFEPTRKALAYILGEERQKQPTVNTIENGVPCLTALQILERITFIIKEPAQPADLTAEEVRILILRELTHLADVAMGRAAIGDWPKPKAAP